jgi:colanic acid biosynthesis glycosyl transferase WcaI
VLVLALNYTPEKTGTGPLTGELCTHLRERGYDVQVIAAPPHYPEWQLHEGYTMRFPYTEIVSGVPVRRVPIWLNGKPARAHQRIAFNLSFVLSTIWQGLRSRKPDLIICMTPPIMAGLSARLLARLRGVPYMIMLNDLELQLAAQLGQLRSPTVLRIARQVERQALVGATAVSVLSESFGAYVRAQGIAARKVHLVPDWVDTSFIQPLPRNRYLTERCGLPFETPVVLHAGNMGEKQGLETLVRCGPLVAHAHIHIVLVGSGFARERLIALANEVGATNVHFLPLQPRENLPEMLAGADVLALIQRPEVVDSVAPSKLLTYLASGRPILASVPGGSDTERIIEGSECGVMVPPGDAVALADQLLTLIRDSRRCAEMGHNARHHAEEYFAQTTVFGAFDRLIAEAMS